MLVRTASERVCRGVRAKERRFSRIRQESAVGMREALPTPEPLKPLYITEWTFPHCAQGKSFGTILRILI